MKIIHSFLIYNFFSSLVNAFNNHSYDADIVKLINHVIKKYEYKSLIIARSGAYDGNYYKFLFIFEHLMIISMFVNSLFL